MLGTFDIFIDAWGELSREMENKNRPPQPQMLIYHFFCEATESADGLKTKQVTYSETTRLPTFSFVMYARYNWGHFHFHVHRRPVVRNIFRKWDEGVGSDENSPDEWGDMRELPWFKMSILALHGRKLYFGLRFRFSKRRETAKLQNCSNSFLWGLAEEVQWRY